MTLEWLSDVVVPVSLGLISAFGATAYTNRLAANREDRNVDDIAASAVRAYENALRNYAVFLEEREIASGHWDPRQAVMEPGSTDKIRAAWNAAQPYFYRLQVGKDEYAAISNSLPDHGASPMEGSENFWKRAELVHSVLGRGLKSREAKPATTARNRLRRLGRFPKR